MTVWLIKMFCASLLFTIIIECAAASLPGDRSGRKLLLVMLVNILTNPPAVLLHWLGSMYLHNFPDLWLQILIEIAVIITEALIYKSYAQKEAWLFERPVLTSITANLCSWGAGVFYHIMK